MFDFRGGDEAVALLEPLLHDGGGGDAGDEVRQTLQNAPARHVELELGAVVELRVAFCTISLCSFVVRFRHNSWIEEEGLYFGRPPKTTRFSH